MNEKILGQLLRHLRLTCKLLAALDKEAESEQKPAKRVRVYAPAQNLKLQVTINLQPTFPDYAGYNPAKVLRMKSSRRQLAQVIGEMVTDLVVGYLVKIKIENYDGVEFWPEMEAIAPEIQP